MALSEDQLKRYSRHIALQEVGKAGQEKLLSSKVLLIGTGGLGSPVAYYLAAAGVGKIGILDSDRVDLSNLNRQILYKTKDLGKIKVEQAKTQLAELNPDVSVQVYHEWFNQDNAEKICSGYDVIVDCLDNFAARFVLNDVCLKLNIPMVHAGVYKYFGQTLTVIPGQGPCLRCIYPDGEMLDQAPSCATDGLIGVIPGVLGTLQVMEVIKLLLGIGEANKDCLLYFDGLSLGFDRIKLSPRVGCICQKGR
jgi:molybdopterin/thiamine biosynthesis adenylyltransferase